jgi:hypothetical protein
MNGSTATGTHDWSEPHVSGCARDQMFEVIRRRAEAAAIAAEEAGVREFETRQNGEQ